MLPLVSLVLFLLHLFDFTTANTATTPVPQSAAWWMRRHNAFNEIDKLAVQAQMSMGPEENKADLLYIGDSIVHRFENAGSAVWEHYYQPRHAFNLGINGDRTQHVLWRLENGNIAGLSPKLAIVMIGQNNGDTNSAAEIYEGVSAIVNLLLTKLPRIKILLLGIFQRRQYPTPERKVLAECNGLLAREFGNHERVVYMDIDNIFLQEDGSILISDMPDFEHPSPAGYVKWAEAIEDTVCKLYGDARKEKLILSDVEVGAAASASATHLNVANGQQGAYASAPLHMHSPFHHWSIVTIFCIVSVVFYFGVYIILTDSNVESKKILTSHLIHKNGGSGNSNSISISTTCDNNSGNSRTVSSAIVRSPGNRSKG